MGISASMSITLDMLAGMASYVGRSTTGAAAVGAGSEAAIAAAIEVAIFVEGSKFGLGRFDYTTFGQTQYLDEQLAQEMSYVLFLIFTSCLCFRTSWVNASQGATRWSPFLPLYGGQVHCVRGVSFLTNSTSTSK